MNVRIIILLSLFASLSYGQNSPKLLKMSLDEVIQKARGESPEVILSKARLANSKWQLKLFNTRLKPQLNLNAKLPTLTRNIVQDITTQEFVSVSSMITGFDVEYSQEIAKTGGRVFASTGISRNDNFGDQNPVVYLSNPITVGFNQPLFSYNAWRWQQKIEPLRYEEAESRYTEEQETAASKAANLFFDVYINQIQLKTAVFNKANADTLLRLTRGRFSVGKIAENELLQMELSNKRSESTIASQRLNLQTSTEQLRNFLGIKEAVAFELAPPEDIPEIIIDVETALSEAVKNRWETVSYERRLLESEQDLVKARREQGINGNVFASFGLSQTGATLPEAYSSPSNAQQVVLGLQIPILDGGRAKTAIKMAESNLEVAKLQVEQDRINFEQNIILKVNQFALLRDQAILAREGNEIALKRYDITQKRFTIGKIGVTDLNLAQTELDNSLTSYMQALRSFWAGYYELRRLTLYDF